MQVKRSLFLQMKDLALTGEELNLEYPEAIDLFDRLCCQGSSDDLVSARVFHVVCCQRGLNVFDRRVYCAQQYWMVCDGRDDLLPQCVDQNGYFDYDNAVDIHRCTIFLEQNRLVDRKHCIGGNVYFISQRGLEEHEDRQAVVGYQQQNVSL